jgi:hypothetical protein
MSGIRRFSGGAFGLAFADPKDQEKFEGKYPFCYGLILLNVFFGNF